MTDTGLWLPPTANYRKTRAKTPRTGEAYGRWAGDAMMSSLALPGGGVLQFDLDKLTLADYRSMRHHYQINISLSVLSFVMHQLDWHIECEDQRIADAVEENIREIWTQLIRSVTQSYWSGYSPNVLQYENDTLSGLTKITKVKDLVPEDCRVNWKTVDGYAPSGEAKPKMYIYDGIKQWGSSNPIPVKNTFWYPLLMENGDHYGRKLLKPAFPAWFFSQLIHLFANRYFERFGEPLPIGRAPLEEEIDLGSGKTTTGRDLMEGIVRSIRNRSAVVLPSDRVENANGARDYEYDIEYLESQLRGADFERYLTRLDEEMSLGIFTPILLTRTADVGSYNLGEAHLRMWLWMVGALAGDLADYIGRYVVRPLVEVNFGANAPKVSWVHRPMDRDHQSTLRAIAQGLVTAKLAIPDLEELGTVLGLKLHEIEQVTEAPAEPGRGDDPDAPDTDHRTPVIASMTERVRRQVEKAMRDGTFGTGFKPTMGYRRKLEHALINDGLAPATATRVTDSLYGRLDAWLGEVAELGTEHWSSVDHFTNAFETLLTAEVSAA